MPPAPTMATRLAHGLAMQEHIHVGQDLGMVHPRDGRDPAAERRWR